MRIMKTILCLSLFAAACFGQESKDWIDRLDAVPTIDVKYDKFQMVTTMKVDCPIRPTDSKSDNWLAMIAAAQIPDNGKPHMMLMFRGIPKRLFNRPTLRFLINDRLLEYKTDEIDNSVIYTIPYYDFERIANAKTAEIQLSPFEGKLDEATLTALKNLFTLTKPQPR